MTVVGNSVGVSQDESLAARKQQEDDLQKAKLARNRRTPHAVRLVITVDSNDAEGVKYLADMAESCMTGGQVVAEEIELRDHEESRDDRWTQATPDELREWYSL